MNDSNALEMEERIHQLVCGRLPPPQRREVLAALVNDPQARACLAEMLELRAEALAAFGYDRAEAAADAAFARSAASGAFREVRKDQTGAVIRRARFRRGMWAWGFRAAAAAGIAVALYLALAARHDTQQVKEQLVSLPVIQPAEIQSYRQVWSQLAGGPASGSPWVRLADGGGEFGYLSRQASASGNRLMLLRCVIVDADGRTLEKLNLLLPAQQAVRLNLPDAGRLAGGAVAYDVAVEDRWATVGVTVGDGPADRAGVRGRVRLGERAAEIGQFRMDGRNMRVLLQVTALGNDVG